MVDRRNFIFNSIYIVWFITCLTRNRLLICFSCMLGIIFAVAMIVRLKKQDKLKYLVMFVFMLVVLAGNILIVYCQ